MKFENYKTKEITYENTNSGLKFLYSCLLGRLILKLVTLKPLVNLYAHYENSKFSKSKIKKFIRKNNINMNDYEEREYNSFNDFFMRKIKPGKRVLEEGFISPCDSKLSVFDINDETKLKIKNSIYTVEELVNDKTEDFDGGEALVFRLCVDDYHRYIYPFDGEIVSSKYINGKLHTVQPIALKKYKVFKENSRVVTKVKTKDYGEVYIIEVGAMMIGKIVNEDITEFKKGDEKGHFEFGGSTIIYLFQKNKININQRIKENTKNDIETIVKMGNNLE